MSEPDTEFPRWIVVTDRFLGWFTHRAVLVMLVTFAVKVAELFVTVPFVVGVVSNTMMIALVFSLAMHCMNGMCFRCAEEAALAGPEMAVEKHRLLVFFHRAAEVISRVLGGYYRFAARRGWSHDRTMIVMTVLVLAVTFVVSLLLGMAFPWAVKFLVLAQLAFGVVFFRARDVHALVVPWCPMCRDDDGDDDEEPVVPPSPEGVKSA